MRSYLRRKKTQFNLMFKVPNTFEGKAFLRQARHYLNKPSYRLTTVATDPLDGKRGSNGHVKHENARTLNLYVNFKNGRVRPMGLRNIKALRREVEAQDGLIATLMDEIERLEGELRVTQADIQTQRSGLMNAVRDRLQAVTRR